MPCYDPEMLIEQIRNTLSSFKAMDAKLYALTIDWRSWRLLAQHINRSAFHADRYAPMTRMQIDGVEILFEKPTEQEVRQWECNMLQYDDKKKKASATSTSTVLRLRHE